MVSILGKSSSQRLSHPAKNALLTTHLAQFQKKVYKIGFTGKYKGRDSFRPAREGFNWLLN
jgi:hypothetical protein